MKRIVWPELSPEERVIALLRPAASRDEARERAVREIMDDVRARGDDALREYTSKFDGVDIDQIEVPKADLKRAWDNLPKADQDAMQVAKSNIERYHTAQMPQSLEVETMPGVTCRREPRALDSAGLYVPGGTAPLVSTVMMLAIPAKIAGVPQRIMVSPPDLDRVINSAVLAAAYLCEVSAVYIAGGAQAIAALSYGTQTIPKCVKIFGPGNAWVASAKSMAAQEAGGPAIDLPAGPSEAMVIADDSADPVFVASDLLSQAEHDVLAQVVCVCMSDDFARRVLDAIEAQLSDLPRADIARRSLENGRMIIAPSLEAMFEISNAYAPEHLIMQIDNAQDYVGSIRNAGSVFLGQWTPESVGDYASGTNHTLPTYGAARAYSGVTLESFMTYMSVQQLSRAGLEALGPTVERLASLEGLEAHRRAISLRLDKTEASS